MHRAGRGSRSLASAECKHGWFGCERIATELSRLTSCSWAVGQAGRWAGGQVGRRAVEQVAGQPVASGISR